MTPTNPMAFQASPGPLRPAKNCLPYWIPTPYKNISRPSVPTIAGGVALGAIAPMNRPVNRTAPAPKEKPKIETWPNAYPVPIARNKANRGWLSRKVVIVVMQYSPLWSATGKVAKVSTGVTSQVPEAGDRRRQQFGRAWRSVRQLVVEAKSLPFEGA